MIANPHLPAYRWVGRAGRVGGGTGVQRALHLAQRWPLLAVPGWRGRRLLPDAHVCIPCHAAPCLPHVPRMPCNCLKCTPPVQVRPLPPPAHAGAVRSCRHAGAAGGLFCFSLWFFIAEAQLAVWRAGGAPRPASLPSGNAPAGRRPRGALQCRERSWPTAGMRALLAMEAPAAALPCCLQAARRAAIEAARGARRWGLVLGTLGRQVRRRACCGQPALRQAELTAAPKPRLLLFGQQGLWQLVALSGPACRLPRPLLKLPPTPGTSHTRPARPTGQPSHPGPAQGAAGAAGAAIRHGAAVG